MNVAALLIMARISFGGVAPIVTVAITTLGIIFSAIYGGRQSIRIAAMKSDIDRSVAMRQEDRLEDAQEIELAKLWREDNASLRAEIIDLRSRFTQMAIENESFRGKVSSLERENGRLQARVTELESLRGNGY